MVAADTIDVERLRHDTTGQVLVRGDEGYDEASTVFVRRGSPAVVVRPRDPSDVAAAVRHAADNELVLSVRGGGHSALGHATNTGGLVIDLSLLDEVQVLDAGAGVVRIGGGATWAQVAGVLAEHGLAITSGDTKSVGVGGLTLGGGIGWMVRKYGLALDSLRAAEVVTADGDLLHASEEDHPDLFWALRGGGANFGVVTSFEFVAQPVSTVFAGSIAYPHGDLQVMLKGWRDAMRNAPDELSTALIVMPPFGDMPAMLIVFCCYAGADEDAANAAIDPLRRLGTPLSDDVAPKPYADVLEDAHAPEGIRMEVRSTFVRSLDDELLALIDAKYGAGDAGVLFLRSLGGAMAHVPSDATAFAHRDVEAMIVSGTILPLDASDADVATALEPWSAVEARGVGAYGGFYGSATEAALARIYPTSTRSRLAEVKAKYDPTNLFDQNHNIEPG